MKNKRNHRSRDKSISEVYDRLASVVNNAYKQVADTVLFESEYGTVVYNKYVIRRFDNGSVELVCRNRSEIFKFGNAKNALTWAILDHYNKVLESTRVLELDSMLTGSQVNAEIHRKMKNTNNIEGYLISSSKLQRDQEKQKQFLYELDKYSILAHKCQQRGTKNEIK